ncbi:hypothetical protein AB6A40_006483 [Gnathostoma spinigerum]|uniref:Uncharacterized protein n=1 Tax=Gnathostoma spinigerum TaxID=75299 RepID=A0ABD6ER61_9BILA
MITEASYIEIMKNCSKWNSRIEAERRSRYPVLDAQTGTAQRPSSYAFLSVSQRYPPTKPSQVCTYMCKRWRKRAAAPSSDATEMKYILQCNPAIADALNQANSTPPSINSDFPVSQETSLPGSDTSQSEKRTSRSSYEQSFDNELDEPSDEDGGDGSDEDDWSEGKKKRKRKAPGGNAGGGKSSRRGTSHANTPQPTSVISAADAKPFVCTHCGARYKSRPGLTYHRAHVHPEATSPVEPRLKSPPIDVSTICDLCLGDCKMNKKTSEAETLISCHDCGRSGHPSCLKFTENMITSTRKYGWQCIECKSCAICGTSDNDDQLLFCDDCDRGFHLYCLRPKLSTAPDGEWSRHLCQLEFGATASRPIIGTK